MSERRYPKLTPEEKKAVLDDLKEYLDLLKLQAEMERSQTSTKPPK